MHVASLPSVSVLIPTKSRPWPLSRCVQSLFDQSVLPRHLVIVDQSPDLESRQRVEHQYAASPSRVRDGIRLSYIHDPGIPGAALARNRAMDLAEGDIWAFLDDDMDPEPTFLEELLKVYIDYPHVVGVSGLITNYQRPPSAFRLWSWVFARGPFHDERQPIYWQADSLRSSPPIPVSKFGSGLMSFRAEAIRTLRFDHALRGVPPGEDVDFCVRVGSSHSLVICPRARVAHNQSSAGRPKEHWLRRYVEGNHYIYRRNWRHGFTNRVCFAWFNIGCALMATLASLRRRSLKPWRALIAGTQDVGADATPDRI